MFIALNFIPISTSEIGHGYRHAAIGDGGRRQLAEALPFGGVVDVLVEWQTVVKAVDESVVHDEVHAAVAAHFLGFLFNLHGDGMEVVLQDFVAHLGRHEAVWVEMSALGEEAFGQLLVE